MLVTVNPSSSLVLPFGQRLYIAAAESVSFTPDEATSWAFNHGPQALLNYLLHLDRKTGATEIAADIQNLIDDNAEW